MLSLLQLTVGLASRQSTIRSDCFLLGRQPAHLLCFDCIDLELFWRTENGSILISSSWHCASLYEESHRPGSRLKMDLNNRFLICFVPRGTCRWPRRRRLTRCRKTRERALAILLNFLLIVSFFLFLYSSFLILPLWRIRRCLFSLLSFPVSFRYLLIR